jgi:invasion protein IalB
MPRHAVLLAALALAAMPASAQQRQEPQRLGVHQSWTAATTQAGGQKVCYAFARAARSDNAPANRGAVTLTVTHRPASRDEVAVTVGYPFPAGAEAVMAIGNQEHRSYAVQGGSAFFRTTPQLIGQLRNGRDAVVRSPAATGRGQVTDTFPLSGFGNAYDAISRECPAPRSGR